MPGFRGKLLPLRSRTDPRHHAHAGRSIATGTLLHVIDAMLRPGARGQSSMVAAGQIWEPRRVTISDSWCLDQRRPAAEADR